MGSGSRPATCIWHKEDKDSHQGLIKRESCHHIFPNSCMLSCDHDTACWILTTSYDSMGSCLAAGLPPADKAQKQQPLLRMASRRRCFPSLSFLHFVAYRSTWAKGALLLWIFCQILRCSLSICYIPYTGFAMGMVGRLKDRVASLMQPQQVCLLQHRNQMMKMQLPQYFSIARASDRHASLHPCMSAAWTCLGAEHVCTCTACANLTSRTVPPSLPILEMSSW